MVPDLLMLIISVFILGTYVVATLDDVLHMAASKSFMYIWAGIAAAIAAFQFFSDAKMLVIRMIIGIVIYAFFCTGLLKSFKIEYADFVAMLPLLFLLPLWYLAGFLALVALLDRFLFSLYYTKFRKKTTYPFMPAILASSVVIIILFYIVSFASIVHLPWEKGNESISADGAAANKTGGFFSFWKEKAPENKTADSKTIETAKDDSSAGVLDQKKEDVSPGKEISDSPLSS